MTIYISGPITNNPNYVTDFENAKYEVLVNGYSAVNPVECTIVDKNKKWIDYMKNDIRLLMNCNAIYMLRGWRSSRGARLERLIAKKLGYKIFYQV